MTWLLLFDIEREVQFYHIRFERFEAVAERASREMCLKDEKAPPVVVVVVVETTPPFRKNKGGEGRGGG